MFSLLLLFPKTFSCCLKQHAIKFGRIVDLNDDDEYYNTQGNEKEYINTYNRVSFIVIVIAIDFMIKEQSFERETE